MDAQGETTSTNAEEPQSWFRRMRQKRWFGWLTDILVLAAVFFGISAWQTRDLLSGDEPAPAFSLMSLEDGQTVTSASLQGKKTVLVLWAPWCTVCGAETGTISALRDAYGDEINVVSIALEYENTSAVQRFVDEHGVDYPVLLGDRGLVEDYKVSAFPTMYILDEEGNIASSMVGYTSGFGLRWRLWLA